MDKDTFIRQSDKAPVGNTEMTQCRNFQSGFCEDCGFAHDPAKLASHNHFPSNSHHETIDSSIVEVRQPPWRGFRLEMNKETFIRQSDKAPVGNRKTTQCRNFQSGFCRYGEDCRFAHDPAKVASHNRFPSIDSATVEVSQPPWRGSRLQPDSRSIPRLGSNLRSPENLEHILRVNLQAALDSATNIEYLSEGKGYRKLTKFINQENLPHETISLFVKLLAREEIRTSLLWQETNKIYGVLTGSPFMLQLNDLIASHLRMVPNLKPQDVRPYLVLMEELQLRSMEGWNEIPLNGLKTVVSNLEESTAKDDLAAIVSRLTDRSERIQRLQAVAHTKQQNFQEEEFRKTSVVPGKEELLEYKAEQKLPTIGIGIQYSSVTDYLETHFRLLREDYIKPLRQVITRYRSTHDNTNGNAKHSESSTAMPDLRVYLGVQLAGIRCGYLGLEFVVSFHLPAGENLTVDNWESSERLKYGALLCISADQFETFFWAVVGGQREVNEVAKGMVVIRIIGQMDANFTGGLGQKGRASTKAYVMVESTGPYFEVLYPVLKTLQEQEMENISFTAYLLHLEHRVSPPSYLQRRKSGDKYDFSCAFPDIHKKLGKRCIRIAQSEWPSGWASGWADSLDRAQQDALKHALTKELAIIQGPPGTGKTYLGLILVKILVANLKQTLAEDIHEAGQTWAKPRDEEACDSVSGPILIICYSNPALDQFLENIYQDGERNLTRVGRQGKSEILRGRNLESLLSERRLDQGEVRIHQRLYGKRRHEKDLLESKIHECIDAMGVKTVTDSILDGIASCGQRQSLFCIDQPHNRSSKQTVNLWLTETDPHFAQHYVTSDRDGRESDENESTSTGKSAQIPLRGLIEDAVRLAPDVWQLTLPQRMMLHEHWLEENRKLQRQELRMLTEQYEEACKGVKAVGDERKLSLLRKAKVVGMTTTGAANHHDVLKSLKPEVVIIEEAAEVLESHVLACIKPSVKHLILMGNHFQPRPAVSVDDLVIRKKLDLSMLERLIRGGVEHVTLQEQRRMRPSISKLVRSLYPGSRDHESVAQYEDVSGMKSNVFFFDHKGPQEDASENAGCEVDSTEAKLVVGLCSYLLNQGCYKPENIAILSMYTGQLEEIKRLLNTRILSRVCVNAIGAELSQDPGVEEIKLLPRVSSVDDYQGEESDIIMLSLLRGNSIVTTEEVGKRGHLKSSNSSICVALTRARKGLFIFGNADLLAKESKLWTDVTTSMRNSVELGSRLELYCQRHPDIITRIATAEDFKQVEDGGCSLPCGFQLPCGHACPRRCHAGSHDLILCLRPCLRQDEAGN